MNILSICCRSWWWCLIIVIIRDAQNDREAGMVRIIRPWRENMWCFYSTSRRMKTLPTSFIIEMLWRSRDETLSIPLDYGTDFLRFGWGGGDYTKLSKQQHKVSHKKTRKTVTVHHEKAAPQHQKCEWLWNVILLQQHYIQGKASASPWASIQRSGSWKAEFKAGPSKTYNWLNAFNQANTAACICQNRFSRFSLWLLIYLNFSLSVIIGMFFEACLKLRTFDLHLQYPALRLNFLQCKLWIMTWLSLIISSLVWHLRQKIMNPKNKAWISTRWKVQERKEKKIE